MKKQKGKVFLWRMQQPCENCPFVEGQMRVSLGRLPEIERGLLEGQYFLCHKTTRETGDGSNLVCSGALQFQAVHHVTSPYTELCRSMEGVAESKNTMLRRLKSIARRA